MDCVHPPLMLLSFEHCFFTLSPSLIASGLIFIHDCTCFFLFTWNIRLASLLLPSSPIHNNNISSRHMSVAGEKCENERKMFTRFSWARKPNAKIFMELLVVVFQSDVHRTHVWKSKRKHVESCFRLPKTERGEKNEKPNEFCAAEKQFSSVFRQTSKRREGKIRSSWKLSDHNLKEKRFTAATENIFVVSVIRVQFKVNQLCKEEEEISICTPPHPIGLNFKGNLSFTVFGWNRESERERKNNFPSAETLNKKKNIKIAK